MPLPLSVIQFPSGSYGFVGPVPEVLAFEGDYNADDLAAAKQVGLGIARRIAERAGRTMNARTFASKGEAIAFASAQGFEVAA